MLIGLMYIHTSVIEKQRVMVQRRMVWSEVGIATKVRHKLTICCFTVKSFIKAPLKNNYDPQGALFEAQKIATDS